jgi:penicillin-binding protein 2
VVLEYGGSGSGAAAPIARRIFDAWLLRADRPGGPYRAPAPVDAAGASAPVAAAAPSAPPAAGPRP